MKRITAIAVTAAAILGCSYVGGAGADTEITGRTTCAQVWVMSIAGWSIGNKVR